MASSSTDRREQLDLLLLHDHRDELLAGARLQVERAHPRLADRVGGDAVDRAEVHAGYPRTFPWPPRPWASQGAVGSARNVRARPCRSRAGRAGGRPRAQRGDRGGVDHDPLELVQRCGLVVARARSGRYRRASRSRSRPRRWRRASRSIACDHARLGVHERLAAGEARTRSASAGRSATPSSGAPARACVRSSSPASISRKASSARTVSRRAEASGATVCRQRSRGLE